MSDRTSASLFARVFKHLAADPTPKNLEFAKELWKDTREYDFGYYQLYCDDELLVLGLAQPCTNQDGNAAVWYLGDEHP